MESFVNIHLWLYREVDLNLQPTFFLQIFSHLASYSPLEDVENCLFPLFLHAHNVIWKFASESQLVPQCLCTQQDTYMNNNIDNYYDDASWLGFS